MIGFCFGIETWLETESFGELALGFGELKLGTIGNKYLNLLKSNTVLLKSDFDLFLTKFFLNFTTKGTSSRLLTSYFGKEFFFSKETVCILDDIF